jgi:hypothetical protein
MRIDVCTDDESDDVEEWHPGALGQELLSKRQGDWGYDPADLHDWPEARLDCRLHLVEGAGARDEGHGGEVNAILNRCDLRMSATYGRITSCHSGTHNQIASENLQNLRLQALASLEDLLQRANQDVTQGRANQSTVYGHLRHARGEVVARLAPVMRNPRCQEFLQTREGSGREHLGAQWVALQLLEVCLPRDQSACCHIMSPTAHHSLRGIR